MNTNVSGCLFINIDFKLHSLCPSPLDEIVFTHFGGKFLPAFIAMHAFPSHQHHRQTVIIRVPYVLCNFRSSSLSLDLHAVCHHFGNPICTYRYASKELPYTAYTDYTAYHGSSDGFHRILQ